MIVHMVLEKTHAIAVMHAKRTLSTLCIPCNETACIDLKEDDCRYGVGLDLCHCCEECLLGPGEVCGVILPFNGSCSKGLECVPDPSPPGSVNVIGKCRRKERK
ncbi:UNVERIFIED_CONTAM: hypothetical protein RMT77_011689 [Armadillidium vulgare]